MDSKEVKELTKEIRLLRQSISQLLGAISKPQVRQPQVDPALKNIKNI